MSTSTSALQNAVLVDGFLNAADTDTVPLFEFLLEYDIFAPASRERTRVHYPPDLFRGFLHCYYRKIYKTRPVTRELQHTLGWYYCGVDKPPLRYTIDRFPTDLKHVIDDVFDQLVEHTSVRGLLDSTYSIDLTLQQIRLYDHLSRVKDPGSSGVHTD